MNIHKQLALHIDFQKLAVISQKSIYRRWYVQTASCEKQEISLEDVRLIGYDKVRVKQVYTKNENILEYPKYKDINDFKESLLDGREIVLQWDNIEYEDDTNSDFSFCEANKPETENHFESIDELLEFKLKTGEILKNVVLQSKIMWRNI